MRADGVKVNELMFQNERGPEYKREYREANDRLAERTIRCVNALAGLSDDQVDAMAQRGKQEGEG